MATGAATGAVAAAAIVVEPIDYAMTAVQCVTSGCSVADVALTVVPGAIGPVARQIDNVLDVAKAAENAGDAVKAVENAGDTVGSADEIVLFGKADNPAVPQTRPGRDGKVSCSSCSPADGIRNSFGREPTPDDMYWTVDQSAVKSNGGSIRHDGGQPISDLDGNPLGGNYPKGHVSLSFLGKSKGWVERELPKYLGPARKVLE